jgi:predicted pyridoxine 5'-phosphate oxidase superfamily flavin-nucleotide-binding protein
MSALCLRINGRAEISIDPDLLKRLEIHGKLPRTVIVAHVEAAYFHCSKALVRAGLWDPSEARRPRKLAKRGRHAPALERRHFRWRARR